MTDIIETPAEPDNSIEQLYRIWRVLKKKVNDGDKSPKHEAKQLREFRRVEEWITDLPCRSSKDFACKIMVLGNNKPLNVSPIAMSLYRNTASELVNDKPVHPQND